MKLTPRLLVLVVVLILIGVVVSFAVTVPSHAQDAEYTAADVVAAIDQASTDTGVSRAWLYSTVRCETGGSMSPYSIGRQGELGAAQLHPRGELVRFRAWGYSDPFDPYEAIEFMAQRFSQGGAHAWTCS